MNGIIDSIVKWASTIPEMIPVLAEASLTTIGLFLIVLLLSLPLGLVVAAGRRNKHKIITKPTRWFLLIMRGTPLILQLMFFYYLINNLFVATGISFRIDRFPAAILAFTLNYSAYFAEIYRGGIESIPEGQYEAAKALGFTKSKTFFLIVLPQVIKRILPPMGNEFITLVKDTALAQTISVVELFKAASGITSRTLSVTPLLIAGVFYLIMNYMVEFGFNKAEKKLSYYR